MWIMTQNKRRIINTDNVIDIFVARTAPVIYANTAEDADFVTLGEYDSKEECLQILHDMFWHGLGDDKYIMPSRNNPAP